MKRILVISALYLSMVGAACSSSDSSDVDSLDIDGGLETDGALDSGKAGSGGRDGGGGAGGSIPQGGNGGDSDATDDGTNPELPDASDEQQPDDSSVEEDVALDINFTYDSQQLESGLQEACVDQSAKAEPVPLDIYFMLDRSGSMSGTKWTNAVKSIGGYVSSANAKGNNAAIQYFPITGGACNGDGYSSAAVGLGLLPGNNTGHALTINNSLNSTSPNGSNTPTEGALRGLVAFTKAKKPAGRIIIGILVTDGSPTACSTSDTTLATIAADHYATNKIHTFMVGMTGADFTKLEKWAKYSGALSHTGDCGNGAASCHHYNVGNGDPAVFIKALNKIQSSVLACTFKVVQPSSGVLNPDLVSVDYYPGNGGPVQSFSKVANAGACGSNHGFYFDNPTNPTTITLCPASCAKVQADTKAQIKIRIACEGA